MLCKAYSNGGEKIDLPTWGEVTCNLGLWGSYGWGRLHCAHAEGSEGLPCKWFIAIISRTRTPEMEVIVSLTGTDNNLVSLQTWPLRSISNWPPLPSPDLENSPHWWITGFPIPRTRILVCLVSLTQTDFFVKKKKLLRKLISSNNCIASIFHSLQRIMK